MNSAEANIIIKPDTTGCNHYTVSEWFLSLSAMIWWINTHIVIWALQLWEWRQNPEIMNGTGRKNLSSSLFILHSKALHFPWTSLSISQMKCDSNVPCGSLAPAMLDIPAQQRAALPPGCSTCHRKHSTELLQAHCQWLGHGLSLIPTCWT